MCKGEKKRPWKVCWMYRNDIVVDRVEDGRVWKSLRARQFADGDHTMAPRNQFSTDEGWCYVMMTYIRVQYIQYARLFSRRLDIRNRRLKDEAFIQPPIQSLRVRGLK